MTLTEKQKFWIEHINKHRQSGLTQNQYCRQNGLSKGSFSGQKSYLIKSGIISQESEAKDEMKLDPFERNLFIFTNTKRNKLKVLYWDSTGFALWVKYLIEDKYKWPLHLEGDVLCINRRKLTDFLNGLDPFQVPFKKKNYSQV